MTFKIRQVVDINKNNLTATNKWTFINYLDTANLNAGAVEKLQRLQIGQDKIPSRAKRIVKPNDILMSTVRPDQRHYGIVKNVPENMVASTGFAVITPLIDKVAPGYLYYFLVQDRVTQYLQGVAETSTSTYPSIKPSIIGDLDIYLPSLEEQKSIAHILSTLDDKIEVNNRINKTLEDMAQAIFKRWFVDFEFPNEDGELYKSSGGEMVESELGMIPKGWGVKTIRDIPVLVTDFVANGSFKSLKDNVNILDSPDYAVFMRNTDLKANFSSGMKYVDKHSYDFLSKSKLFGGEVIISNVGDVGSVYLCPIWNRPMTLGNNVIMMKSTINPVLNNFFYRLFLSREGQSLIDSITGGSAQPKFNKTDFRGLKIVTPPFDNLITMLKRVNVIEDLLHHHKDENMRLIDMRDTLLPKLMSGEIRVPIEES